MCLTEAIGLRCLCVYELGTKKQYHDARTGRSNFKKKIIISHLDDAILA